VANVPAAGHEVSSPVPGRVADALETVTDDAKTL
jgi:hypothetical protein